MVRDAFGKERDSNSMKIAVLGAGAMGMLFGGYLSRENHVYLVDVNPERIEKIRQDGVMIREPDGDIVLRPDAVTDTADLGEMDLIIVFVKAMFTVSALQANKCLIGKDTYLMTLQNGAGHEAKLLQFVDKDHVIIGSTQHNSSVLENGHINHGGGGKTSIGLLNGHSERILPLAQTMTACGIDCTVSNEVKRQIWNKLFLNTAASSLTAVLQVPLGFIAENPSAWAICETLVREAVAVAAGEGLEFDADEKVAEVRKVCTDSPAGLTSIYADLRDGRRTEVDTISGSVIRASERNGVPAPTHRAMVQLVHAMEQKHQA